MSRSEALLSEDEQPEIWWDSLPADQRVAVLKIDPDADNPSSSALFDTIPEPFPRS